MDAEYRDCRASQLTLVPTLGITILVADASTTAGFHGHHNPLESHLTFIPT